ncbi:MAG TPA: nucleotidyltransferase family protein [Longimicrobiales bacterium]
MVNSLPLVDPELTFLIRAIGAADPLPDPQSVRDWPRVVALARTHRVYPRVWQRTRSILPGPAAAALHDVARQNLKTALRNLARTVEVVQLLRQHDVDPIVIKGPLLARALYCDYAARVAGDIDLLVREGELLVAAQALAAAGYHHHTPLDARSLARHRQRTHDVAFAHPGDQSLIELHADIAQPHYGYRVDLEGWHGARSSMRVGDQQLSVLWLEHMYLLAGLHAAKHRWHRLDLLSDLAAFHQLGIDAGKFVESGLPAWMIRVLRLGDDLTRWFFGLNAAADSRVTAIARQILAGESHGRMSGIWFDLGLRAQPAEQARYLWRRFLSAKLTL